MPPSELTQRTAVTGVSAPLPPDDGTRELRDEVVELARALPGDLRRLVVRSGERAIEVEWAADAPSVPGRAPQSTGWPVTGRPDQGPDVSPDPDAGVPAGISAVRAPLVGTFYASPSPGADPFVRVGDEVDTGQTIGIVEAMKLMNPIVADEPGVVSEILVGDTESVEYDQILMHLRPAGQPR